MKNLLKELFPLLMITIVLIILSYLIIGFISWNWAWIISDNLGYIFTRAIIILASLIFATYLKNEI